MFYGRRKRLGQIAKAEAEGQSFWTDRLDERARAKLFHAVDHILSRQHHLGFDPLANARQMVLTDLGLYTLSGITFDEREDVLTAITEASEDVVFSLIESVLLVLRAVSSPELSYKAPNVVNSIPMFEETVRTVLREHRVRLDLVDINFVPLESRVLHESVAIPSLTLLGQRRDLVKVEAAFQAALREIHNGSPDDAITDAATALQEALVALGCEGNSLGPLARSAQTTGIITSYDRKLIDWVSADRSNKGDAHNASPASIEDAWLVVYVVGALILRIAGGTLREVGDIGG